MTTTHLTQLTDVDPDVRLAAAFALGSDRDPQVPAALVERLGQEQDPTVRETLTWACVQHADTVRPLVVAKLGSDDAATRSQAAHVLSKMGGDDLAQHLGGVIADADPLVAVKAFRAAASTKDPAVVPALVARLGDADLELRDALSVAFSRLGSLGVPALVEALGNEAAGVRAHAAEALAHVGSPDADGAVGALSALASDADDEVRLAAVMALGALEPDVAKDALVAAADGGDPRVAAVAKSFRN